MQAGPGPGRVLCEKRRRQSGPGEKAQGRTGYPEDEACCPQRLARRIPRNVTVRIVFSAILSGAVPVLTIAASSVQVLVEQGDRLTQTDEGIPDSFTRAITLYDEAAALDPQNPLPPIRKARACLALGDWQGNNKRQWYERGERAAERALALKGDSADAHFFLAANRGNVVNLQP